MSEIGELVEKVAKALVEKPEDVSVSEVAGERSTILELRVADGDLGRVIGKEGRIAKAMRTLVKASATKEGSKRVELEIID